MPPSVQLEDESPGQADGAFDLSERGTSDVVNIPDSEAGRKAYCDY